MEFSTAKANSLKKSLSKRSVDLIGLNRTLVEVVFFAERTSTVQNPQSKESESDIAWGCAEIGKEIGRTERQTFHLCSKGSLPVTKVGGQLGGQSRRLRKHVGAEG